MPSRLIFAFALLLSVVCAPLAVRAEVFPVGAHARSEYLRLRNLDPAGDAPVHAAKWVRLAEEMNGIYLKSVNTMPSRDLLFAADTHIRVYRANRSPGYLKRGKVIVDTLLERYPSDAPEYGEALVLRGDIAVAEGAGNATGWYERVGSAAPHLAARARSRVQSLSNGTFGAKLPSSDLEVPRVVPARRAAPRTITKRIVLDPGHGGFDAGAVGKNGLEEKELTLEFARRVKVLLERDSSIAVHLTRTDDTFVPLARRTGYANSRKGDAFVSLHLNASPSHQLRGLESYYLDTTDDEASRLLAERENGVPSGGAVDDLTFILSDLIQSGKLEESVELSHYLESAVHRLSLTSYPESKSHGVKKGPFYVLVGAHMPCTLIELFFIDNPGDGAKLATDSFRSIVSEGLAQGLTRFALGDGAGSAVVAARSLRARETETEQVAARSLREPAKPAKPGKKRSPKSAKK
jgi:N-acetylmuramoyl-L-alanine amidase